MGALPARWLGELDREGCRVQVRNVNAFKQPYGDAYWIDLDDLSQGETFKVARALKINPKDYASKTDRVRAIKRAVDAGQPWRPINAKQEQGQGQEQEQGQGQGQEQDYDARDQDLQEALERARERQEQEPKQEPKQDSEPVGSLGALDPIIDAVVRRSLDNLKGDLIDADTVRNIVADELSNQRPIINHISINGDEPRKIEGRTHSHFEKVLQALMQGEHVWLVGPPGTGKSTLAEQVAEALNVPFYGVSCYMTMPDSRLFGYMNATGDYVETMFRRAYDENGEGGLFLFDESDQAHPGIIAGINQALANRQCAFADGMVRMHKRCFIMGAANTHAMTNGNRVHTAAQKLPAAFLDRFTMIEVDTDTELERDLLFSAVNDRAKAESWLSMVEKIRRNVQEANVDVFVTPRAVIGGAKLLINAGWSLEDTIKSRVIRGQSPEVFAKLVKGVL